MNLNYKLLHIKDKEEGFPPLADNAGGMETFLQMKKVDYFVLSAVRNEVS